MATLQFTLPPITGGRRRPVSRTRTILRPVMCAAERQALFNRIAPVYDNLNDLFSLGRHRVWKRMTVSSSGAKEGDTVLDVCCGSGDLAFHCLRKLESMARLLHLISRSSNYRLLHVASASEQRPATRTLSGLKEMQLIYHSRSGMLF
ncbi:hypothetical protein CDL12_17656 [Handroanthus impetiginosus]|uniref:2-phytyl-1,4-beta-naphthoquinone methyltransferase, chloroplastic n=1 Tax=Handroanthus impetiginosus TaxID=429701 RepID=A0A2G9GWV9_9LAMI|nr:hypothetical protein CDL12_17656 [Handroanthus impetiginosus]